MWQNCSVCTNAAADLRSEGPLEPVPTAAAGGSMPRATPPLALESEQEKSAPRLATRAHRSYHGDSVFTVGGVPRWGLIGNGRFNIKQANNGRCVNFLERERWLCAGNSTFTIFHVVTSTVLGDLCVLLRLLYTSTNPPKFSVFYRAGMCPWFPDPFPNNFPQGCLLPDAATALRHRWAGNIIMK
jgi:hypothetical protein